MDLSFPAPAEAGNWIGVLDSGLGGLAVVREIARLLPGEKIYHFADTLRMPYGSRSLDDVRALALAVAEGLLRLPAKAVVVACNTASGAALAEMRRCFPGRIFVGMEPAVKPAVRKSAKGIVGVLATPTTFKGEPFKRLERIYGADAEILPQPCPGLAEAVERHGPLSPETEALVVRFVEPLLAKGVDCLVLGCTHYSLAASVIERVAGPGVEVVDPSPAIARRVREVLGDAGLLRECADGELVIGVSGDPVVFSASAALVLGEEVKTERRDFVACQGARK